MSNVEQKTGINLANNAYWAPDGSVVKYSVYEIEIQVAPDIHEYCSSHWYLTKEEAIVAINKMRADHPGEVFRIVYATKSVEVIDE